MDHYVPILIFALVAFTVPIIILLLAKVVRFGSYDPVKAEPYECGVKATSFALDKRFSIRYYVIAVLFVVFDVETIFLFPWAVIFDKLALFTPSVGVPQLDIRVKPGDDDLAIEASILPQARRNEHPPRLVEHRARGHRRGADGGPSRP